MLHQTTNLGVRSSNLFGRAMIVEVSGADIAARDAGPIVRGRAGDAKICDDS